MITFISPYSTTRVDYIKAVGWYYTDMFRVKFIQLIILLSTGIYRYECKNNFREIAEITLQAAWLLITHFILTMSAVRVLSISSIERNHLRDEGRRMVWAVKDVRWGKESKRRG